MWLREISLVCLFIACCGAVAGQQTATLDTNFRANLTTNNSQENPAAAMDADGDYVIVWESLDQDGSGYGVYARCYNRWGEPRTEEFQVNTNTFGDQRGADVAMDADGNFTVVWMDNRIEGPGNGWGARRRSFDCGCAPIGSEARMNSAMANHQKFPKITMRPDGNFYVIWNEVSLDGASYAIEGRPVNAMGANLSSDRLLSDAATSTIQSEANIASDDLGNHIVTWMGTDSDGTGIYAARFDPVMVKQGADFLVNSTELNNQSQPVVGANGQGDFQIAWTSFGQDGDAAGVFLQMHLADGTPTGTEIQVAQTNAGNQYGPAIATTREGNFTISWSSYGTDGSYDGVYVRMYDDEGNPFTSEQQVSTRTMDFQQSSSLAQFDSGRDLLCVWQDGLNNSEATRDGGNYGIYFQRYFVDSGDNATYSGTIYVDKNASGNNRGGSWLNAFEDLSEALRYATTFEIDSILVAEGTYYTAETFDNCYGASSQQSRDDAFEIPAGMTLIGSYPEGGGSFEERNVMSTPSILSADIGILNDTSDNSYHVVKTIDLSDDTEVNGFVITGGSGENFYATDFRHLGGGWLNWTSNGVTGSLAVENCRFLGNSSFLGGAMTNYTTLGDLSVSLINCTFSGNKAGQAGGAILAVAELGIEDVAVLNVDIINCSITGNTSSLVGGGIAHGQGADGSHLTTLTNTILFDNSAVTHNEIFNFYPDTLTLAARYSLVGVDSAVFCGSLDSGAVCGDGMIYGSDPLFNNAVGPDGIAGTLDDDLTIDNCSDAEDSGSNIYLPSETVFDIGGNPRIFYDSVDIGAFENQNTNTYMVINKANGGVGSLRQAIINACLQDTIIFDPSLAGETIALTGSELNLNRDLYILGLGVNDLTISGNFNSRIGQVALNTTVGMEGLTLTGGISATDGGAILNNGNLTLKNIHFNTNLSAGDRRSVTNFGTLNIGDSVFMFD